MRRILANVALAATHAALVIGICLGTAGAAEQAPGGLREDANRAPLYAARKDATAPLPYVAVRVGEERRYSLAASGREQLALRPAQLSAGGRVFVFAKIPQAMGDDSFPAEFLVWVDGHWERRRVVDKKADSLGHISATLIVDKAPVGPIPTAVFRRSASAGQVQSIVSMPVERVPSHAHLQFGYALDEWDWTGLAPVEVSVSAIVTDERNPEGREVHVYDQRFDPTGRQPGWVDATADLSALAGAHARLVFRAEPIGVADRLAPHLVWSAPTIVFGQPERSMPSVVLVLADGLRARSLGCCGAELAVSPFLDRLFGDEGVIFEHAVTQAVETIPSLMTLFTGVYPCVHQIYSARQTLARDMETFAQIMSSGGYATAAFTDSAGLAAEIGFGRGFDTFYQDSSLDLWNTGGTAHAAFEHAGEWIERHSDQPFLVVVHTRQAKPPYVPPPNYLGLFQEAGAQGEVGGEKLRYAREIRYLDDALSEFVGKLDTVSSPRRTLLVVSSAHGEEFLEHGAREHGAHLYDETVRVPLLMRGAGVRAKRKVQYVVGLIDVAPTVLELAGFTPPPSMQGTSMAVALRKGRAPEVPPRFSEAHALRRLLNEGEDVGWKAPAFSISNGDHKLITYVVESRRAVEAYDLGADPGEKVNLVAAGAASPSWLGTLRGALESYTNECGRLAHQPAKTETLPVSTLFKLKAFGYL